MAPRGLYFFAAVRNGSDSSRRWHYMPTARNWRPTDAHAQCCPDRPSSGSGRAVGRVRPIPECSEVLREGLRLIERREAEYEAKLRALREAVQVGIDDMEAGRYTTLETPAQIDEHITRLT